jgi:hypothetical protein
MISYFFVNMACFAASYTKSPGWRPGKLLNVDTGFWSFPFVVLPDERTVCPHASLASPNIISIFLSMLLHL